MRYIVKDGNIEKVKSITVDGMTIHNPSDSVIDSNNAGFPFVCDSIPEYDPISQCVTREYTLIDNVIHWSCLVEDLSAAQIKQNKIDELVGQIEKENNDYTLFLDTPVLWDVNNHTYKPRWLTEYYSDIFRKNIFPVDIYPADQFTAISMDRETFTALCNFLSGTVSGRLQQNASVLQDLYTQKALMEKDS